MGVNILSQIKKFLLVCATGGMIGAFTSVMATSAISDDPDMVMNFITFALCLFKIAMFFFFCAAIAKIIKTDIERLSTKRNIWENCVLGIVVIVPITLLWGYTFWDSKESDMMFATPFVCTSFQNAFSKNKDYISLNPEMQLMCEEMIGRAHKDYRDASSKKDADS